MIHKKRDYFEIWNFIDVVLITCYFIYHHYRHKVLETIVNDDNFKVIVISRLEEDEWENYDIQSNYMAAWALINILMIVFMVIKMISLLRFYKAFSRFVKLIGRVF